MEQNKFLWWQYGSIYQIYPRSFQDTNGDGVGDLKGIISRLDYLKELGIKAIWLSPIYPSPMADFGYDISDYENIHPLFGTLEGFDKLVIEVHQRDLKLILDLVPNHTSDKHPWFIESRSSKDNPRRNWYIWKDAKPDGSPPNNWLAAFGGTGWEWDEKTNQYYYHAFLKEQPDLNWRNPEVQEAMFNVMRFWMKRGVDGFRIDVLWHLIKDELFRDNPINPDYKQSMSTYDELIPMYSTDQPEVHDVVKKMRSVVNEFDGRVIIGEIYLSTEKLVSYYGTNGSEAHLPFNFQLILLPWQSNVIHAAILEYEAALPKDGWPNWVLGNHDQPRIASRVGNQQAKVAAMLLLTLRGTPTVYYGDEIGMEDVPIPADEIQDPQGLNMPDKNLSRDPARTPMQWDITLHAGFSTGKSWLRAARNFAKMNVSTESNDPDSMLTLYRKLFQLRNKESALNTGSYTSVFSDRQMLSYIRKDETGSFLILLNLSHRTCAFSTAQEYQGVIQVSTSTEIEGQRMEGRFDMRGDEGIIVRLDQ